MRIDETAADLPVLAAIASACKNKALKSNIALIGEVGLAGEIRGVSNISSRVSECINMGVSTIIVPAACKKGLHTFKDADIIFVSTLEAALGYCFD